VGGVYPTIEVIRWRWLHRHLVLRGVYMRGLVGWLVGLIASAVLIALAVWFVGNAVNVRLAALGF
jgi:hypothetical protein